VSRRERDRLRVLHEIQQKQITQTAAARRLKISDRHIRRLLLRLEEYGDRAVIHMKADISTLLKPDILILQRHWS
jgi:Homeodomain-like domain-containing protein